jgi:two-component system chemotaxis response regulator CheB
VHLPDVEASAADTARAIVVIGGSAGCLPVLVSLLAALPGDFPAAVLVTVHTGEHAKSNLPIVLSRAGQLPAEHAGPGQPLTAGRVLVAPQGAHLQISDGVVELGYGPRVNRVRPSIDVLFSSAAASAGKAVVALMLSGTLDDGAVGSALIARAGGTVIVQDPDQARFPSMPRAAQAAVRSAVAAPAAELPSLVFDAVRRIISASAAVRTVPRSAIMNMSDSSNPAYLAPNESGLTRLACPECGGGLAEVDLPPITYFRCHIGHQYAPHSLLAAQADALERKLWAAVAALEEHAVVLRYHAEQRNEAGPVSSGQSGELQVQAEKAARLATHIRENLPATIDQTNRAEQG